MGGGPCVVDYMLHLMVLDVKPGPTGGRLTFEGRSVMLFRINFQFIGGLTLGGELESSYLTTRVCNILQVQVLLIAFLLLLEPTPNNGESRILQFFLRIQ